MVFSLSQHLQTEALRERLAWLYYDLRLNTYLNQNPASPHEELSVSIIDIDEKALRDIGHWPGRATIWRNLRQISRTRCRGSCL